MKLRLLVCLVTMGAACAMNRLAAQDNAETVRQLKKQLDEIEQKIRKLEQKSESQALETNKSSLSKTPVLIAGEDGFGFRSTDTNFVLKLKGVLQVDSRSFFNDHGIVGNDTFLLRRARPVIEGTVYHDFDFLFVPDFGGSSVQIFDAYVNYRNRPELQFRVGK